MSVRVTHGLVRRGPTSAKNGRLGDTVMGFVPVVLDL